MQKNTQERPIYFYVANLGSEVQRIFSWKEKNDEMALKNAYNRALGIIETVRSFGNMNANTEMNILQKVLEDLVSGNKSSYLNRNQMSSYFNPFAWRVINNLN
jgi:DNA/RNA-binding domain of Phe-tRNA-synthetase-like protein